MLTWWRKEVAGQSQRELAEHLRVARTSVTNWERGTRLASLDVDRIDRALDAGGVLAGLLWAFGTPEGLEPVRFSSYVFPESMDPVWMWVRSESPDVGIQADWGLYRFAGEFELGENGMFVTVGASIDESPVVVQLSAPGWIDFGRGELPTRIAGAPVKDAIDIFQPSDATGGINTMLSTNLHERFEHAPTREMAELGNDALKPVESFLDVMDRSTGGPRSRSRPPVREGLSALERSRFVRMRKARKLSFSETAARLTTMTDTHVGKDTLRRFESGTGKPHDPLLPVALDHVLGGNGHLALTKITGGHGSGAVSFPPYWRAPVWLDFVGPERDDADERPVAELQWGSWRRRITGQLPMQVISHSSMVPLRITTDPDVHWTAGVGRLIGATPIDDEWVPDSVTTTQQALSTYEDVLLQAVKHASTHRHD